MSLLNRFKKEFEGLNINERMQNHQSPQGGQTGPGGPNDHNSWSPPQSFSGSSPYPVQHQTQYDEQYISSQYPTQHVDPGQHQYSATGGPGYTDFHAQPMSKPLPTSPSPGPQYNYSQPSPTPVSDIYPAAHPLSTAIASYGAPSQQACPAPPRWIPFWSEQHGQWYYAETTGRAEWTAPFALSPMPAYTGNSSPQGDMSRVPTQSPAPGYVPAPNQMRPGPSVTGDDQRKSSSHTMLAAAGGFVAGGIATALVYEAVDSNKKKKRHGTAAADFDDFAAYPAQAQDRQCNVCDQDIYGPYAHCNKCDHGDYDVCRDCLAQGVTCDGKGKHTLVKVYPKYECDGCSLQIRGNFYHCNICHKGDWDVCQACLDRGFTCKASGKHRLAKLYIPTPKAGGHKKHSGSSSSSSGSDDE